MSTGYRDLKQFFFHIKVKSVNLTPQKKYLLCSSAVLVNFLVFYNALQQQQGSLECFHFRQKIICVIFSLGCFLIIVKTFKSHYNFWTMIHNLYFINIRRWREGGKYLNQYVYYIKIKSTALRFLYFCNNVILRGYVNFSPLLFFLWFVMIWVSYLSPLLYLFFRINMFNLCFYIIFNNKKKEFYAIIVYFKRKILFYFI